MAENQKSIDGIIEKLAMIVDAADELFPDGKMLLAFELKETEFKKVYQEETGEPLLTEDDGLEELELYLGQTYGLS